MFGFGCAGKRYSLDYRADGAQRDIQVKNGAHDLCDSPSGSPVDRGQVGHRSVNTGTEVAFGHLRRQRCPGHMAAGTGQLIATVFGLYRVDFGKLKHLVSQGAGRFPGFIGCQSLAAFLTGLWKDIHDMIHFAFRKKSPLFAFVPDLPSTFAASRLFAFFLHSWAV